MVSELFLDLYRYESEKVIEVFITKKYFEEDLIKRNCKYDSVQISKYDVKNIEEYDLLVMYLKSDISKYERENLNYLLSKSNKFIIVVENKLNFHKACDYLEKTNRRHTSGISLRKVQNIFSKQKKDILTFFHSVSEPLIIAPLDAKLKSYISGRSGRDNGKRKIVKVISVLVEIIVINLLKIKSFYPGYIVVSENL